MLPCGQLADTRIYPHRRRGEGRRHRTRSHICVENDGGLKRRLACAVQRDNLAINDRSLSLNQSCDLLKLGKSFCQVTTVARDEAHLAIF